MLRIDVGRSSEGTTVKLAGRVRSADLQELARVLASEKGSIHLDLAQIQVIDLSAVDFFIFCEDQGMALTACPGFVAEWIHQRRINNK